MEAPIFAIARHRLPVDGQGVTTLVTFSHCPLSCKYCLNPQCEDPRLATRLTPEALLEQLKIDNLYFLATGGGVTLGGGEPTLYSPYICQFKALMMQHPDYRLWRLTIETSLAVSTSFIERLAPIVDEWIIDVKDMHPDIYERYTQRSIASLLTNLQWLCEQGLQHRCRIRVPLIPSYNTPELQAESRAMLEGMGFEKIELFDYVIR